MFCSGLKVMSPSVSVNSLKMKMSRMTFLCAPVGMFDKLVWSYTLLSLDESFEVVSLGFSESSPGFLRAPYIICLVGHSFLHGSFQLLSDSKRCWKGPEAVQPHPTKKRIFDSEVEQRVEINRQKQ